MSKHSNSPNIDLHELMEHTVMEILKRNGVLKGNKVFGTVIEVENDTKLIVEIDQMNGSRRVNCSPHVEYGIGDRVIIEFINNDPRDMFVLGATKRGYRGEVIDYDMLPTEPVEIIYNTEGKAISFIYGYDNPNKTWRQSLERNDKGQVVQVLHQYPDGYVLIRDLIRREEDDKVIKYE